ncbi:hydrolase (plasmid) [Pseudonocardia sp. EC080610-09]|nr:hydrolase [Pseudonocardia sp. EC080610-09]ALL85697.1 hydrolase [Pseudonocardia sp. EC080619-01]
MVLLHGATSSWRAWRPLLPILERRHRVFAPTLAGHLSGTPLAVDPERVVPAIVDDVEAAMDEIGMGTAHLAGNSLGGWVALELARRGRATSVVALSPAGAWRRPRDLARLLALFRVAGAIGVRPAARRLLAVGPLRDVVLRGVSEHPERLTPAEVGEFVDDLIGCTVLPDLLRGARASGGFAPLRTGCPVLLAWGAKDKILPFARYGRPMIDAVPGADVARLPGVGHVPMPDDPLLVARTILDYAARVDSRGRSDDCLGTG